MLLVAGTFAVVTVTGIRTATPAKTGAVAVVTISTGVAVPEVPLQVAAKPVGGALVGAKL